MGDAGSTRATLHLNSVFFLPYFFSSASSAFSAPLRWVETELASLAARSGARFGLFAVMLLKERCEHFDIDSSRAGRAGDQGDSASGNLGRERPGDQTGAFEDS